MPSFDIVSEVDKHQLTNAVDQSNRIVATRFDFKGVDASFKLEDFQVTLTADAEFQVQQMQDILRAALIKCGIDPECMAPGDITQSGKQSRQLVTIKHGLDAPLAKKIVKLIKDQKLKVQAAIQGEQVRVTGKKRDDLQQVIAMLKEQKLEMPLQYANFRD